MKPKKPRGYYTQCCILQCGETTVLEKPGKWRCPKHVKKFGELIPDPRPTAPMRRP